MRQRLGPKKLRRYSDEFGKTFVAGLVRGNSDHRVDLLDDADTWWNRWSGGTLTPAWTAEDGARKRAQQAEEPPYVPWKLTWEAVEAVRGIPFGRRWRRSKGCEVSKEDAYLRGMPG